MARHKIDYGIDLGTTNSAIARMEDGKVRILKSDDSQSDTTPSCVHYNRKQAVIVGDKARNALRLEHLRAAKDFHQSDVNTYQEFKRTMGTSAPYSSSHMNKSMTSPELSAEVLKKLRSYVRDETIRAIAVTVPARFEQHQFDATSEAARLAGFDHCELLQEPIAASLAYGVEQKKIQGHWLVFDFGGGTFDAVLMKVDEGVMKVVDTDGANHLGGKDLDFAIVDHILLPSLAEEYALDGILADSEKKNILRNALKWFAETAKVELSSKPSTSVLTDEPLCEDDEGQEVEIDIDISLEDYEKAVGSVFQRAIDISHRLLERNGMTGADLETVILVGGPTYSQTLRKMIRTQVTEKCDTSIDPMTAVAVGAALYASTKDIPSGLQERDMAKVQLQLKYEPASVHETENLGIRIDRAACPQGVPEKILVEIHRGDKGWASARTPVEDDAEIVELHLLEGKTNSFLIRLFDEKGTELVCEPSEITILSGLKVAKPVLQNAVCIEAFVTEHGKALLVGFDGLDKNKTLPAKGKNQFTTQKDLRPGNKDDKIHIRIYNGTPTERAVLHNWAGTVTITGDHLPALLPKNSEVVLTLSLDESRRKAVSAFFPYLDETVEEQLEPFTRDAADPDKLDIEIENARNRLEMLMDEDKVEAEEHGKIQTQLDEIEELLENGREEQDTPLKVQDQLREIVGTLDRLAEAGEWPVIEKNLEDSLIELERLAQRTGNPAALKEHGAFRKKADTLIARKNVKLASSLNDEIRGLCFEMLKDIPGFWINFIKGFNDNFDSHDWKDRREARRLLEEAKAVISATPTVAYLRPLVIQLFALLPRGDMPIVDGVDEEILRK